MLYECIENALTARRFLSLQYLRMQPAHETVSGCPISKCIMLCMYANTTTTWDQSYLRDLTEGLITFPGTLSSNGSLTLRKYLCFCPWRVGKLHNLLFNCPRFHRVVAHPRLKFSIKNTISIDKNKIQMLIFWRRALPM